MSVNVESDNRTNIHNLHIITVHVSIEAAIGMIITSSLAVLALLSASHDCLLSIKASVERGVKSHRRWRCLLRRRQASITQRQAISANVIIIRPMMDGICDKLADINSITGIILHYLASSVYSLTCMPAFVAQIEIDAKIPSCLHSRTDKLTKKKKFHCA